MSILIHVSAIITDPDHRFLMVREAKTIHRGLWNLPGGHVEDREELHVAAVREVREETSLDVSLKEWVCIVEGISPELHSIRFTFVAETWSGVPAAGDEILETRWMRQSDILAMTDDEFVGAAYLRAIIEYYLAGAPSGLIVVKSD